MITDCQLYTVWLTQISGIGTVAQHKLLKEVGSAKGIYEAVSSGQYQGVYSKKLKNNLNLDAAKIILEDCAHNKIRILTMEEGKLPDRFEKYSDLPILLYAKGIDLPLEYGTGIVGARRCSSESKIASIMLAQKEILRGRIIVSGMAKGIDSYAHTAAIKEGGTTIAVLGFGLNVCYPKEHSHLMSEIQAYGIVVSEYPPETKPRTFYFTKRNRIIAALSDYLYVVEMTERSGSVSTVESAERYGVPCDII